jgi:hypothetical protein
MGFHFCDPFTLELVPAPLFYRACGFDPLPRLPREICPRCYDSGVEMVPNSLGLLRALPCECEMGQRAKRQMIASVAHDTLYLPAEAQMDALGVEARGEAWYYRSLLEEDAAKDRRDKFAYAVQGL